METSDQNTEQPEVWCSRTPLSSRQRFHSARVDPGSLLAGRYRIEHKICEGGMGVIYLATQLELNRQVAIKFLRTPDQRPVGAPDLHLSGRFAQEAVLTARLSHPNIVTIHDYGRTTDGGLFFVMEYIHGHSLADFVRLSGPPTFRQILRIGMEISQALREAHRDSIIHRDLKPENVMIIPGEDKDEENIRQVKVLDFGLAKILEAEEVGAQDKTDSTVIGSPRYMSPEQICGDEVVRQTDLYGLGIVLYFLVAVRAPFCGSTSQEILYGHVHEAPPRFESVTSERACPPALAEIIYRCLEKLPEDRFASASEVFAELRRVYRTLGDTEESAVPFQPEAPTERRYVETSGGEKVRLRGNFVARLMGMATAAALALSVISL